MATRVAREGLWLEEEQSVSFVQITCKKCKDYCKKCKDYCKKCKDYCKCECPIFIDFFSLNLKSC